MVQVILLAAGLSRRFGEENKLTHKVGETSMLNRTLINLSKADIGQIILITGHQSTEVLLQIPEGLEVKGVHNSDYLEGMTSSIQKGVLACSKDVNGYLICLADQIHIKPETYSQLVQQFETHNSSQEGLIVVPYYQNQKGNPVVISSFCKNQIMKLEDSNGCKSILKANPDRILAYHTLDQGVVMDIDSVDDLVK